MLRRITEALGLDTTAIDAILASNRYADAVREHERGFQRAGIHSVHTFIVDRKLMISGAQQPRVFAEALRHAAAQPTTA